MQGSSILNVDDSAVFRRVVRQELVENGFQIAAEASDCLDAVAKARELQPNLVLLDMSIPKVNGIEAVAISSVAPESKVLFPIQNTDPDIVEAALRDGAAEYFHKSVMDRDLLPAEARATNFGGLCSYGKREMERNLLSAIRILIVDDFEDWRRQVLSLFHAQPGWQVIAEATDGSEAVEKAEKLKPDLIVLDIGLPKLNGIGAARQIRQLSPSCKILFLSHNSDLDVVRAALGTAEGFVCKTDFHRDFLPGIRTALRGQPYVSSSLKRHKLIDSAEESDPYRHEVHFYSDDVVFLESVARFIATGLKSGRAAIAILTESHRKGLVSRLKAQGLDIDAALQQGTYIPLDVTEILSTFMVHGMPDTARFFDVAGSLIEAAAKATRQEQCRVVVCGECSPTLWGEGKAEAAIRVEQLFDQVGKAFGLDAFCGYAMTSFHGEDGGQMFQRICAEHSAVCS